MEKITFNGFKALDNKKEIIINLEQLTEENNFFENTDISKTNKLRIWIDIDGKIDNIDEDKFYEYDNIIIDKFKNIENVSLMSSSNYDSEKWTYNKTTKKYELEECVHKLSYRITYINEYCSKLQDIIDIVKNIKEKELQQIFKDTDITIGTDKSNLLNIDTSVYRRGMSKMRCVNSYKYEQQKERINKLLKGEIIDTLITYIPDNCKLLEYKKDIELDNKRPKKNIVIKEDKEIKITENNKDLIKLLDGLSSKRYDEFYFWIRTYWIFLNEKLDLELFIYFSKKSKYYNEEKNNIVLKNFKCLEGYKLSTLYYWLKEDNYNLFVELQKTRKDFWNTIQDMNHSDLAKLYYSITPTNYVRSNKTGWYEYNSNNILTNHNSVPPSLLNDLSNKLQNYVLEQRNLLLPTDENYNQKISLTKKSYIQLGNSKYIKCVIDYLNYLYTVDNLDDLIDNDITLLAFNNILYDVKINKFRDIKPEDYICKNTRYNIITRSNLIIRKKVNDLLKSIFEDTDMEEYWKIITGLSLFTTKLQSLYIHQGSGGNGKGLLSSVLKKCLGDYFLTAENTFLTTSFKAGSPNPTLANAKGVRYLFISEPDDGKDSKFNIDFIKTMTGGDEISARDLYKSNKTYIPQFTANVQCNDKPELGKIDKGIVRRIKIIPYLLSFVDNPKENNERKRNYNLTNEIFESSFINEFMLMLLEKASEYYNKKVDDILLPKRVLENTKNYEDENNPVKDFCMNYIKKENNDLNLKIEIKIALDLYNSVSDKPLNNKQFINYIKYNGYEYKRSNSKSYIINASLIERENNI